MSVEYTVAANLVLQGDGAAMAKLDAVGARADRVSRAFHSVGERAAAGMAMVGSVVGSAIDRMASLTVATAKWGAIAAGGGAIAAAKVGLLDVNAQLEKTELGFATLFTMFGAAPDFQGGLQLGKQLLEGIRQDAAALPGEFQDFASMAQTMTAPLTQLGEGIDGIRRVTRETVVTAAALGVNFDQAAREMSMLLEGHAGAHNVLGMRLGIRADTSINGRAWHEAASADRLRFIEQLMGKTAPALDAYSRSWAGMTSTLVDSTKHFLGEATGPLFERMKGGLQKILAFTEAHKDQIRQLEIAISNRLIAAYDFVEAKVAVLPTYVVWLEDHWGEIRGQVYGVGRALEDAFEHAWPVVKKVGEFLGHELEHPATALKELLALRLGAAALQTAPAMFNAASGAVKLFGAGAETAATGGALAGAGEAGAAVAGGAAAGVGGAALAAIAVPIVAAGVAIFDDVAGSATLAKNTVTEMWDAITAALKPLIQEGGYARDILGHMGAVVLVNVRLALVPLELALKGVQLALELVNAGWTWLKDTMNALYDSSSGVKTVVDGLTDAFKWLVGVLKTVWDSVMTFSIFEKNDFTDGGAPIDKSTTASTWIPTIKADAPQEKPKTTEKAPIFYAPGAKFEIKLDVRNDNPDRIVRRVFDSIGKVATRPLTSPYAPPSKAF